MMIAIAVFGALICLGSLVGIASPAKLIGVVRGVMNHPSGLYFAVVVRLILGAILILAASQSLFPTVFRVLGVVAILAAVAIPFVGRARLTKLMEWFAGMPGAAIRGWLIFGFAFGAILVYGTGLI